MIIIRFQWRQSERYVDAHFNDAKSAAIIYDKIAERLFEEAHPILVLETELATAAPKPASWVDAPQPRPFEFCDDFERHILLFPRELAAMTMFDPEVEHSLKEWTERMRVPPERVPSRTIDLGDLAENIKHREGTES